jgi:hypothetical protein
VGFSATIDPRNAQLTSRTPTLEERFVDWLNATFYGDDRSGRERAERITDVLKMTPARIPNAIYNTTRSVAEGGYLDAAVNALDVPTGGMSKAILIGVASPKFPKKAIDKAVELEKRGFDNEVIKSNTQIYRGADGHWRYDLPLDKDEFALKRTMSKNEAALLTEVVNIPNLIEAEPRLANSLIVSNPLRDNKNPARYLPKDDGHIEIMPEIVSNPSKWYENPNEPMFSGQRIVAHEASHGVDHHQGMNPTFLSYNADLYDFLSKRANPDSNFVSLSTIQPNEAARLLEELSGPDADQIGYAYYLAKQHELNARHSAATVGMHPTVIQNLPTPQRLVGLPDDAIALPKSLGGFSRQLLIDLDKYRSQGNWNGTVVKSMDDQAKYGYR